MNDSGEKTGQKYLLTLYVASMNARARFAVENIRKICEEYRQEMAQLPPTAEQWHPANDRMIVAPTT